MTAQQEVLSKLASVVKRRLGHEIGQLELNQRASEIAGWDSLAHIDIILALEDIYGIRFTASELASLDSIGDLVALVIDKAAA